MKKIMYKITVAISVLSMSLFASADCDGNSCIGVKITRLFVTPEGNSVVGTSGNETLLNCDAGTKGYLTLDSSSKNYNATYALILASHTTEHPIWLRMNESGTCSIQYVVSDR